jgi:diguanylate cyclase (GGDEF)-like protein/PAS domain S-box-containing protein
VHAVAQAVLVLLFALPLYRLPGSGQQPADRVAQALEVMALMVATALYVWFFVISELTTTDWGVVVAGALITSAMAGVLLGARIVLTGYVSPYRGMLLRLGGVMVIGGLAPGVLVKITPYDVDAGLILVPVASLILAVGARPAGAQPPLSVEQIERWRERAKALPLVAVACTDALLLGTLANGSVSDRLVVGVTSVVLTALVVARQLTASRELGRHEQRFRQLVQNSYDVVTISDLNGTITYMSGGSQRMFGRAPGQRTGANIFELLHPEDRDRVVALFSAVAGEPGRTELWRARFQHADGRWRRIEVLTTNLLQEPSVHGIVSNTRDVTETHELAERLSHEATHDVLTGLANRSLFSERLAQALTGPVGLVLVDLDDFKIVNDTLGHAAGDELLVAVAARLEAAVGDDGTVARLGGDEFAVLLPGRSAPGIEAVLREMIGALRIPVVAGGREQGVRASFGVVEGGPGDEAGDLIRCADTAMYEAKARGDGGWQHYLPGMQARGALQGGEFSLSYEPVVNLADGSAAGTRASITWRHPQRGLLARTEWLGAAEQSGMIVALGRWALREACGQRLAGTIGVEVSARELREPGFADDVADALRSTGLPAERLILSITGEATAEAASLDWLRRLGVRISLGDFGSGASSLTFLAKLAVDQVEVAASLVADDVIATAVRQLTRGFGVEAVVTAVATAEQAAHLAALGYDRAQGPHFAGAPALQAAA